MYTSQSRLPRRELRPYVRAYAQRVIEGASTDLLHPAPASLESIIELDFGEPPEVTYLNRPSERATRISLVGPGTYRRGWVRLRSPLDSFGIFFQPLGISQLFGVPERLLVNDYFAGADVFSQSISRLWERMAADKRFDARARIVDQHLMEAVVKVSACTVLMASARHIFRQQGSTPVRRLAQQMSLSVRQYERRFVDEIGITPKLFARITRFQMAMDAKMAAPGRTWLDIAHHFGYHDQMHMIKDFQKLSGESPNGILSQLGETRPEALVTSAV